MKADVLKLNESLDSAIYNAMLAVESGNFIKVINLLEYVKKEKAVYDKVMINYALLISYMNTGQIPKAMEVVEVLDNLPFDNPEIKNVVDSVKKDISARKQNSDEPKIDFDLDMKLAINLAKKHPNDGIWNLAIASFKGEELARSQFNAEVVLATHLVKRNQKLIIEFDGFDDKVKPLDLFAFLNDIKDNHLFWYMHLLDVSNINFELVFANKKLPLYIKKFYLERYINFRFYGLYSENMIFVVNNLEIHTVNLRPVLKHMDDLASEVIDIYKDVKIDNFDDFYESIIGILMVILIEQFPMIMMSEDYDFTKTLAITSYVINDFIMGRKYDKETQAITNIKFGDIKEDIKNYEYLLTFLLRS